MYEALNEIQAGNIALFPNLISFYRRHLTIYSGLISALQCEALTKLEINICDLHQAILLNLVKSLLKRFDRISIVHTPTHSSSVSQRSTNSHISS